MAEVLFLGCWVLLLLGAAWVNVAGFRLEADEGSIRSRVLVRLPAVGFFVASLAAGAIMLVVPDREPFDPWFSMWWVLVGTAAMSFLLGLWYTFFAWMIEQADE